MTLGGGILTLSAVVVPIARKQLENAKNVAERRKIISGWADLVEVTLFLLSSASYLFLENKGISIGLAFTALLLYSIWFGSSRGYIRAEILNLVWKSMVFIGILIFALFDFTVGYLERLLAIDEEREKEIKQLIEVNEGMVERMQLFEKALSTDAEQAVPPKSDRAGG